MRARQRRAMQKRKAQSLPDPLQPYIYESLDITAIDLEAQGIARAEGKVIFVAGAIPGETVMAERTREKAAFDKAKTIAILRPSAARVTPRCPHVGVCGGCSMQHVDAATQLAIKQRALEDNLWHIGKVRPEQILPAIAGTPWGYRYRARLSVKAVRKRGEVLVGFHEKASRFIADIQSCAVIPPHVSALLLPLRHMVAALTVDDAFPQIELGVGHGTTVLVARIIAPMTQADRDVMHAFAVAHSTDAMRIEWWLQLNDEDDIFPLQPDWVRPLHYVLPEFGIVMPFKATDFTQVNHEMNRVLVGKAIRLLDIQAGESVLDLFCGLGNFTLPLARTVERVNAYGNSNSDALNLRVLGIEGSDTLVTRATDNATHNQLAYITTFLARNLFTVTAEDIASWGLFDRWLIDPPREGAQAICQALADLPKVFRPKRIVYVSCSPATLARDAGVLTRAGWCLSSAGVANMFPQTSHVESIAVFDAV